MSSPFDNAFLNQIRNIRNNFILSLAAAVLLVDDEALDVLEGKSTMTFGKVRIPPREIARLISAVKQDSEENLQILISNYLISSCRALFIDLYEAFKEPTERFTQVKDLNWYIFLGNLRITCAHGIDAVWKINDFGKGEIFYIRQSDGQRIAIDKSWEGQSMRLKDIGGVETLIDLIYFVEKWVVGKVAQTSASVLGSESGSVSP